MSSFSFHRPGFIKGILVGVGGLLILLVIFQLGIWVGYAKAHFSYQWGENYHRNFGGPQGGFMSMMRGDDFINDHGVFGSILKIDGSTITVQGQRDTEVTVLVSNTTTVKRFGKTVSVHDLSVGDWVVVIGQPRDSGQIEAQFIRIMPPRPSSMYFNHDKKTFVPEEGI